MVDSLLRQLVRAKGPEIQLCAPASPLEGWGYFQSDFADSGARFLHSRLSKLSGRAWQEVCRYAARRQQSRGLTDRGIRRLLYHSVIPYLGRLDADGLAMADVYHSPHGCVPAEVRHHPRIKVFLTVYDLIPFRRPEFFLPGVAVEQQQIMGTMRLGQDRFFSISESTKRDLCELYPAVDPARVFVVPLAASPETFYPCGDAERRRATLLRYGVPEDGRYVLSVCTLEPRKNLRTVLRAFRALWKQEKASDLRLVLVGGKGWFDGPLMADLDRLGAWKDRVHLLGYVNDSDIS